MLKLKRIAITGVIASGKSSVAKILQKLGAYVVSADEIVHNLLSHDASTISQVQELLGPSVRKNGSIDRKEVGDIVFKNPDILLALEKILHPKVKQAIEKESTKTDDLFVAEIPLYFEAGVDRDGFFDAVVVVTAPEDECIERSKWSKDEYNRRNQRMIPLEEKIQKADFVITNDGDLSQLNNQTKSLYQQLRKSV